MFFEAEHKAFTEPTWGGDLDDRRADLCLFWIDAIRDFLAADIMLDCEEINEVFQADAKGLFNHVERTILDLAEKNHPRTRKLCVEYLSLILTCDYMFFRDVYNPEVLIPVAKKMLTREDKTEIRHLVRDFAIPLYEEDIEIIDYVRDDAADFLKNCKKD